MIYDETIVYALTHPEGVRYDSTPQTLERDREELRKSAIKMTPKPITIFTRIHDFYPYNPYLLVKQFDPTSMETIKGGPNPHGTRV